MRSSVEYKVMGLAAYGETRFLEELRDLIRTTPEGGFAIEPPAWDAFAKRRTGEAWEPEHADLAASVQARLEEVLLDLAIWVHGRTGDRTLTMAGGVALNCLANSRLRRDGPFEDIWIQPAAGDAGTALGAALALAQRAGDRIEPMTTAALGRGFDDDDVEARLRRANVPTARPDDLADTVAATLADDGIVAWFQGRAEYGPRALGHRSLLADPRPVGNLERMNDVKGREQFRPIAPIVLADRAADVFEGPLPSPYMLFTHDVRPEWRDRMPAVTHVDGSARIQTVDPATEPLLADVLRAFERRTGVPVLVNTSLNTAGRPIVDSPADVLELFGSAPVDLLAIGPFVVRRAAVFA
jgi:carbamoyltransferase